MAVEIHQKMYVSELTEEMKQQGWSRTDPSNDSYNTAIADSINAVRSVKKMCVDEAAWATLNLVIAKLVVLKK